ncbi:hypothetical protein KUTeg_003560 [Tegillarca granosa]|uniref:C-type lectin domain-containing protein n=1 Tax=Tegillarca granosa TaxID=220873 RepID=A0ABQ9FMF9_TEGGR|nr:hypothetical protein KUTeg_003560 [Tegillarca granosa]
MQVNMKLFVAVVFVLHLLHSVAFGVPLLDEEKSLLGEIKAKIWLLEQLVKKRTEFCNQTPGTRTVDNNDNDNDIALSNETDRQDKSCPFFYDMDPVTGICYRIYHIKRTWAEARQFCERLNQRLLVLDDRKKFDRFREILSSVPLDGSDALQVGFKYSVMDSKFLWLTGKEVESNTWGKNQPNLKGEMCGGIGIDWGDPPLMLHDASCNHERLDFICEQEY